MSNKHKILLVVAAVVVLSITTGSLLFREQFGHLWDAGLQVQKDLPKSPPESKLVPVEPLSEVSAPVPAFTMKRGRVPAPEEPPTPVVEAPPAVQREVVSPGIPPAVEVVPTTPEIPPAVEVLPPQPLPEIPKKATQPQRRQAFGLYHSLDFIVRKHEPFKARGRKLTIAAIEAHLERVSSEAAAGSSGGTLPDAAPAASQVGASTTRKRGRRPAPKAPQPTTPDTVAKSAERSLLEQPSTPVGEARPGLEAGLSQELLDGLIQEVKQQLDNAVREQDEQRREALQKASQSADLLARNLREVCALPAAKPPAAAAQSASPATGRLYSRHEPQSTYYGVRLVRPGENLWNIHYAVIQEYFARRNLILAPTADERGPNGRSSGVARLLKFIERVVFVYDLDARRLASNINLLRPYHLLVFFKISDLFAALDQLQPQDINRMHFLSYRLWLQYRGEHRYLLDQNLLTLD
jgi:hypothetical protein